MDGHDPRIFGFPFFHKERTAIRGAVVNEDHLHGAGLLGEDRFDRFIEKGRDIIDWHDNGEIAHRCLFLQG